MIKLRGVRSLVYFTLFLGLLGILGGGTALAAREGVEGSFSPPENQAEKLLSLFSKYPAIEGKSGDSFQYEVELRWRGPAIREFTLDATVPQNWRASFLGGYEQKKIGNRIVLQPIKEDIPERVTVTFEPIPGTKPAPGDYSFAFKVSSSDINESIDLKAKVTGDLNFAFYSSSGLLNTQVTAGKEHHFSIRAWNTGTLKIDTVNFFSSKPPGWEVTFNPDKIESLEAGSAEEVDVLIKTPEKTITGDYLITLQALVSGLPMRNIELRTTVTTPTVWGWVGIFIVLAVIAGVAVMFRRLGRR